MSEDDAFVVYRLKVSLRGISPMIWRRLLVPAQMTLYELHRAIQLTFGWEDYHLHAFKLHGREYSSTRTGERHRSPSGDEVRLADLQLRLRQRIVYEYDFGDMWVHEIRVESKLGREDGTTYPTCIGGGGAGPPEDVGGSFGYYALLARLADEEYEDDGLSAYDAERFSRREVNAALRRELWIAGR
ncbi:plasmid pRiA4b ORF-3 family protein [Mesorhizobium microcysteis]|uniref:Plasmid pRiA4b ORF-3 family protein n=1 Tax=Neoaquamicrobium microcysteis TaxID=2682781 RepID=A0A5D4H6U2_9HYPH|nr:plasmid pRiA4b ORF-3 family protein [Mesorhizobium microcysteis]TYR36418.1 plasmid pRiA4b ORF-3 family protein [Mesorhizobium microcysteis]